MKCKLYLDFDGVVNAVEPQHSEIETFSIPIENSRFLKNPSLITYSPNVINTLDRLREQYNMELIWLTTWNDRSDILLTSPYLKGLDGGRVITPMLNEEAKNKAEWTQWKADAIIADQTAEPAPYIWVDDNAHQHHSQTVDHHTRHITKLFVTPQSRWGLTNDDLNQIEAFLQTASLNH